MAFLALLFAIVLIVAAIRNTHGALFAALQQDVPGYVVWASAIIALGAIGFIPNLKPISRALLALVFMVIILKNYRTILSGFTGMWQGAAAQGSGGGAPQVGGATGTPGGSSDWMTQLGKQFGFDFSDLTANDTSGNSASVNG